MILVGSQRGGGGNLAAHLMNDRENDHVTVVELRGFIGTNLREAFDEAHAISKATKATQYLFSLSLNPPKGQEASLNALLDAAERAEQALGLRGQPRAIVIHEKKGRRHAHVVWSRIDVDQMKAINMPFFKARLSALSKELYLDHGWELPDGHKENGWKNPLNFSLAEWQQAKRLELDPREIRQVFAAAWQQSDGIASFRAALEESGYFLARGDRRGFVALDIHGEVFAVARWLDVKSKAVTEKLGAPDVLPSVEQTRAAVHARLSTKLRAFIRDDRQNKRDELQPETNALRAMVTTHRAERDALHDRQEERWRRETRARSKRLNSGLRGAWDILTGKAFAVKRENEHEAYQGHVRDRDQREHLFTAQTRDRQPMQDSIEVMRRRHRHERMRLARRIVDVLRVTRPETERTTRADRERGESRHRDRPPRGFDMGP